MSKMWDWHSQISHIKMSSNSRNNQAKRRKRENYIRNERKVRMKSINQ